MYKDITEQLKHTVREMSTWRTVIVKSSLSTETGTAREPVLSFGFRMY